MALVQLIYVSSMVGQSSTVVGDILASCAKNNPANGITGMLLYYDGSFMQVLEGEEADVDRTYARIAKDSRHTYLVLMARESISARHFAYWSMGYRQLAPEDVAKFPEQARFFNFKTQADAMQVKPGLALKMLTLFSKELL